LKKLSHSSINQIQEYVHLNDLQIFETRNCISASYECHLEKIELLFSQLNCTKLGVELGIPYPNKFEPSHELALCHFVSSEVCRNELSKERALSYLKGETFLLDNTKKGFQLVSFKNQPLGWINHLGNRFNNMYPKEWRIRMNIY
jgi:NOL1/NOP2/fmu family ribosome biogenesis protein